MNETLKKELTERFRNDMERMDSPEYLKAAQEYESQVKRLKAAHAGANLNFDRELEELDSKAWIRSAEYATDSFIFGYEYCLTMLGLDNEKAPSQQGA